MGFTKTISIENQTGSGVNTLNGRGGLPALSAITAQNVSGGTYPQIRLNQTVNERLTAYLLDSSFVQSTYNGGVVYITNQNGIFSYYAGTTVDTVFPFKLYYDPVAGYNTIGYSLMATGQECASGIQIGSVYWTLSSTALSGTSAGTIIPVDVNNTASPTSTMPSVSTTTQVFCLNTTALGGSYICDQDRRRVIQAIG